MYRFLVLLTLALPPILADNPSTGLRFADSVSSYIMLKPDMQPVREKISICMWANRTKSSRDYNGKMIGYSAPSSKFEFMMYSGAYFYMLGEGAWGKTPLPIDQWVHRCITWSFTSKTKKYYYNGKLTFSAATPSGRKLAMGGSITIGLFGGDPFGGELFKLNIFSKQLTDEEISEMYKSGMCSEFEESLTEETFLKWDTLLNDTPLHDVEKFSMTQCPSRALPKDPTEADETKNNGTSNYRHWNILYTADFYNQVVTSELLVKLSSIWEVLAEFKGHVIDDALIKHLLELHL